MSKKKTPSLKYQMLQRIDSLKRFGQSKHEAKQAEKARCEATGEKWNPAKVEGIYSMKTCDTYKEHALNFCSWARETHAVRHVDQISKDQVGQWLQQSIDKGHSAWTVKVQAAAMAKVLGCKTTDFSVELPARKRADIQRSRGDKSHDKHFSEKNHMAAVQFSKGTGLRRTELMRLKPEQIYRDQDGRVHLAEVKGKGGRVREVPVTKEQQQHVWKCKLEAKANGRAVVFAHVPNRMDVHSYRREYAMTRYQEVYEERIAYYQENPDYEPDTYNRRDGKKFDRYVLGVVSQNMGHTRIDVIPRHYLD
ncbi:site-specific integrase [Brevibacillus laterosporus]|uniref:site-specific integrase n=1 Tax=Brevibacillus laterosporus TaxID=1465 RepID=UPI003D1DFE1A